jgi:hypothetical protein
MEDNLAFLEKRLAIMTEKWQKLIERRANASPDSKGGVQISIADAYEEITTLEADIQQLRSQNTNTTHRNIKVSCVVLVSKRQTIIQRIGQALFDLLPDNRYHRFNKKEYHPFEKEASIDEILKEKSGFPFNDGNIVYFGISDLRTANLAAIKKEAPNIILVADPVSLSADTRPFTNCFDYPESAGIVIAHCRSLYKHDSLTDEIDAQLDANFSYHQDCKKQGYTCPFYAHSDPNSTYLIASLERIFKAKFKIERQIKAPSSIRNMFFGMR